MNVAPAWVAPYIGLPWRALGRARDGLDCWGLFRLVMAERFGVALPSHDAVGWGETGKAELGRIIAAGAAEADWHRIDAGCEREGDGVLLRVMGQPIHVGVVVAPGLMLHIEQGLDTCIERYDGPMWQRRRIGFYRHAQRMD